MDKLSAEQQARFRQLFEPTWRRFKEEVHPATTQKADRDYFREHVWQQALAELERAREEAYAQACREAP